MGHVGVVRSVLWDERVSNFTFLHGDARSETLLMHHCLEQYSNHRRGRLQAERLALSAANIDGRRYGKA